MKGECRAGAPLFRFIYTCVNGKTPLILTDCRVILKKTIFITLMKLN